MVQTSVPELYEDEQHSVVEIRTDSLQTLRELGPPDLVHLVKQPVKSTTKQIGVYHHVTGVDASSSASLAAYINTLTYQPHDKQNKVISGLYCCYNAFSRVDMRVQVQIPGTVESYCVDERGNKLEATEEHWLETYLCSVLRAYSYADNGSGDTIKRIIGVRRFNPITSTEQEHKFLEAAEKLFFSGWQLGSDPEIQVPNLVSNHLTSGLLHYIKTSGRYMSGVNLFEKLRMRDPEVASLLARVYMMGDEEVKAVKLLHDVIEELPMDYSLLDCQAEFCNRKGRSDMALDIAKRSVIAAPSEFGTWARLAEIYVGMEEWDLALLTLNSCPMFTYQDKDAPRLPEPARISLPLAPETMCDEIDDAGATPEVDTVHPTLRRLAAGNYKGTFHKAYVLLTEITKKIGWDQLLRIRSQVFVMEEEYRNEKQHAPGGSRNASTVALRGRETPQPNGHGEPLEEDHRDSEDMIQSEADSEATDLQANGEPSAASSHLDPDVSKPTHTITVRSGDETPQPQPPDNDPSHQQYTQFQHKRLCERWLDNLFMVLYEDLRIYTIWRTEASQYRQQQLAYKKSAEEWEILGELAERLHHPEEAVEAWQSCLSMRFSPKAMRGVLDLYERKNDGRNQLGALIRLVAWQYRWYSEFSPDLLYIMRRLIEEEGAVKVRSIIQATSLPQHILDLTHQYAALCAAFRSSGSDDDVVDIVTDGDVLLDLGGLAGVQKEVSLRVSGRVISLASPVLRDKLYHATGASKNDYPRRLSVKDEDGDAMLLTCNIIHLRNDKLPPRLPAEMLYNLAILSEKLQCGIAVSRATSPWFDRLFNAPAQVYVDTCRLIEATILLDEPIFFARFTARWIMNEPLDGKFAVPPTAHVRMKTLSLQLQQRRQFHIQALRADLDLLVDCCSLAFAKPAEHYIDYAPGMLPDPDEQGRTGSICRVDEGAATLYLGGLRDEKIWPATVWPPTLSEIVEAIKTFNIPEYDDCDKCEFCEGVKAKFSLAVTMLKIVIAPRPQISSLPTAPALASGSFDDFIGFSGSPQLNRGCAGSTSRPFSNV
ncbi:hypothetical protein D0867_07369 [Hortaea werneckii]|uniref:BTB domain-containing protein n=1 Tax=Hortaea werneckii TaxID=91943 RepID=A0A3M6ZEI9_HORWE|nr:hypothetical protein D0867_07369 [Hortaea werneckii]